MVQLHNVQAFCFQIITEWKRLVIFLNESMLRSESVLYIHRNGTVTVFFPLYFWSNKDFLWKSFEQSCSAHHIDNFYEAPVLIRYNSTDQDIMNDMRVSK